MTAIFALTLFFHSFQISNDSIKYSFKYQMIGKDLQWKTGACVSYFLILGLHSLYPKHSILVWNSGFFDLGTTDILVLEFFDGMLMGRRLSCAL